MIIFLVTFLGVTSPVSRCGNIGFRREFADSGGADGTCDVLHGSCCLVAVV